MLMQSLRCYVSLWPPHVYPWKGIPLEGVWREGKRGRDVLGYPYTLAPRYLLKETLVTVGYPLGNGSIPTGLVFHGPDGPGFPLPNGPIHCPTGLDFHCPMGPSIARRAWISMGQMDPSTGLVFHGPVDGPLEQWAHPLNSCSTRLIVDGPIVTMGNPLYKGPESPRVSLTRIGI